MPSHLKVYILEVLAFVNGKWPFAFVHPPSQERWFIAVRADLRRMCTWTNNPVDKRELILLDARCRLSQYSSASRAAQDCPSHTYCRVQNYFTPSEKETWLQ